MKKYRASWYDMEEIKFIEPDLIIAEDEKDATNKAYIKYGGRNTPAPLLLLEEVK